MKDKYVITYLIVQEMKFKQIVHRLNAAGLEIESGGVYMLVAVLLLMGVPMQENGDYLDSSDDLRDMYYSFIRKPVDCKVDAYDSGIEQLAEACYYALLAILHIEKKQLSTKNG